ncbi:MAG: NAD(P)-dependent oxidoreductase, partial [Bacteroidetes bacterium]|nr:NAD(P)-dependent oxidoreductase [Bacteroidota bacterium]
LKRGYEMHAGVRKSSSRKYLADERIRFFELDFTDEKKLEQQFSDFSKANGKFDFIIHNAGLTKAKKIRDYFTVNSVYTKNFIDALIASGSAPSKFIYMSSLAAFGPGVTQDPIRHNDNPRPVTSYGKSKLESENYLRSLNGFPFIIIRPTAVYGPRDKDVYILLKMLKSNVEAYIGFGKQVLSFVYVKDLVRAIFMTLESSHYQKEYFVSDGAVYDSKMFNAIAKKHLNKKTISVTIPTSVVRPIAFATETIAALFGNIATLNRERLKEFEARNWSVDSTPLQDEIGFRAEYDLERGLKETIDWYKANGWL